LALQELEYRMVTDVMSQMFDDSTNQASPTERNALIRYQLSALLLRIEILHRQQLLQKHASLLEAQRFNRFQQCVEQHFAKWRQVREYASALGCSEKSLTRATREVAGITAKTFIAARVNLEAKRLLVHTALPVAMIADSLGFDEPTNFIKFFKLEAGCTPAEFRRRHR
jgi:AraC-like DNA-binding protein